MKQRATKERRSEVIQFVYMHREEVGRLIQANDRKQQMDFVERMARPDLEYSPNTWAIDIWININNVYSRLKKYILQ